MTIDPNARPRERNVYMTPVMTWPKLRKMSWRDGLVKLVGVERPLDGVGIRGKSDNNEAAKVPSPTVDRSRWYDMINGWPVCVRRRGKTESDGSEKVYLLGICWTSLVTCQLLPHIHWFSSLLHLLLVPFFRSEGVFYSNFEFQELSIDWTRWWFLSLGSKAIWANPKPIRLSSTAVVDHDTVSFDRL